MIEFKATEQAIRDNDLKTLKGLLDSIIRTKPVDMDKLDTLKKLADNKKAEARKAYNGELQNLLPSNPVVEEFARNFVDKYYLYKPHAKLKDQNLIATLDKLESEKLITSEQRNRIESTAKTAFESIVSRSMLLRYHSFAKIQNAIDSKQRPSEDDIEDLQYGFLDDPELFSSMPRAPYLDLDEINNHCDPGMIQVLLDNRQFFSRQSHDNDMIKIMIGAISFMNQNPQYAGYKLSPKVEGKDIGFILNEPKSGERWFVKRTNNEVNELWVSRALIKAGVKYPEAKILHDGEGTPYLMTLDMSRAYAKPNSSDAKRKSFKTMYELSQTEKNLTNTLLGPENSQDSVHVKARNSFAKVLIAGQIFGLSDLGAHLGNIGSIAVEQGNKRQSKLGLVDFQTYPRLLKTKNILADLRASAQGMQAPFHELAKRISDDEFKEAIDEMLNPKLRVAHGDLLVTSDSKQKTRLEDVLEQELNDLKRDLAKATDPKVMEKLDKLYEAAIQNVQVLREFRSENKPKPRNPSIS